MRTLTLLRWFVLSSTSQRSNSSLRYKNRGRSFLRPLSFFYLRELKKIKKIKKIKEIKTIAAL